MSELLDFETKEVINRLAPVFLAAIIAIPPIHLAVDGCGGDEEKCLHPHIEEGSSGYIVGGSTRSYPTSVILTATGVSGYEGSVDDIDQIK